MLICSYLHMRPQKSEANYPLPYPLFLTRLPEIVHSAGGLVRHFQTVKVVQQSFLELQLKCPHWEHINWQRRRRDTPSCFLTSQSEASVISTLVSPLPGNSRLFQDSAEFEREKKWQTACVFVQPKPMLESMSSCLFCYLKKSGKSLICRTWEAAEPGKKNIIKSRQNSNSMWLFVVCLANKALASACREPHASYISHDLIIVVGDNNAHGDRKTFSKTVIVFSRLCGEEAIGVSGLCLAREKNESCGLNPHQCVLNLTALQINPLWCHKEHQYSISYMDDEGHMRLTRTRGSKNFLQGTIPSPTLTLSSGGFWREWSVVWHVPPWWQFTSRQQLHFSDQHLWLKSGLNWTNELIHFAFSFISLDFEVFSTTLESITNSTSLSCCLMSDCRTKSRNKMLCVFVVKHESEQSVLCSESVLLGVGKDGGAKHLLQWCEDTTSHLLLRCFKLHAAWFDHLWVIGCFAQLCFFSLYHFNLSNRQSLEKCYLKYELFCLKRLITLLLHNDALWCEMQHLTWVVVWWQVCLYKTLKSSQQWRTLFFSNCAIFFFFWKTWVIQMESFLDWPKM